jgi:hypothetical protein
MDLEIWLKRLQSRAAKLPLSLQRIFFDDLTSAAENRLMVMEKVGLNERE